MRHALMLASQTSSNPSTSLCSNLSAGNILNTVRLLNDRRRLGKPALEQQPPLDPPRRHDLELVSDERLRRHGEHLVELLERELLRLAHEAEDHEPCDEIEAGVEAKGTSGRHDGLHAREGKRKDTSEGVVDADSPCHALLTLDGGEDLGGVLKGDGSFTKGIAYGEEIDKEHDGADTGAAGGFFGLEEGETSGEEEDTHEREGDHSQGSAALGVDEEEGGDREDDLDSTVAEGSVQSLGGSVTDVLEDGGAVERDN